MRPEVGLPGIRCSGIVSMNVWIQQNPAMTRITGKQLGYRPTGYNNDPHVYGLFANQLGYIVLVGARRNG